MCKWAESVCTGRQCAWASSVCMQFVCMGRQCAREQAVCEKLLAEHGPNALAYTVFHGETFFS